MAKGMAASTGGAKSKKGAGAGGAPKNAPTLEAVREFLDDLHTLADELSATSSSITGKMNKLYEKAAVDLGMTKTAIQETFKEERREKKAEEKARKMSSRDHDALALVSQVFGEDSPIGIWAAKMAAIKPEGGDAEE